MKKIHNGWTIYFTKSGSNSRQTSVKAKHPDQVARLEIVLPDSGWTRNSAIQRMKDHIDYLNRPKP